MEQARASFEQVLALGVLHLLQRCRQRPLLCQPRGGLALHDATVALYVGQRARLALRVPWARGRRPADAQGAVPPQTRGLRPPCEGWASEAVGGGRGSRGRPRGRGPGAVWRAHQVGCLRVGRGAGPSCLWRQGLGQSPRRVDGAREIGGHFLRTARGARGPPRVALSAGRSPWARATPAAPSPPSQQAQAGRAPRASPAPRPARRAPRRARAHSLAAAHACGVAQHTRCSRRSCARRRWLRHVASHQPADEALGSPRFWWHGGKVLLSLSKLGAPADR